MIVQCHRCGTAITRERVGVRDVCDRCSAFLHCCRNCEFYEPGAANDCREPTAERVADKEQGNFCDFFRSVAERPAPSAPSSASRAALDALFRKR